MIVRSPRAESPSALKTNKPFWSLAPNPEESKLRLEQIVEKLRTAKRAQVLGHERPDGDCIGSLLGMHEVLEHFGIENALAASDQVYSGYRAIPNYDLVETQPRADFNADLTIFVDCADRKRAFPDWSTTGFVINIDHHGSNPCYGGINWVDPGCAAVGEMIFYLASYANVPLSANLANALLLAIVTDTGSLHYSNVRAEHFDICAELVRAGASPTLIARAAYESKSPMGVKLGATILSHADFRCDGHLAWSEARQAVLNILGGSKSMPENLVAEIRGIEGVDIAVLFTETAGGGIRVSFRGDGLLNLGKFAEQFGGGGHPNAAGISIKDGDYLKLRDRVLTAIESAVEAALEANKAEITDGAALR